jgi:hypothetical protein
MRLSIIVLTEMAMANYGGDNLIKVSAIEVLADKLKRNILCQKLHFWVWVSWAIRWQVISQLLVTT